MMNAVLVTANSGHVGLEDRAVLHRVEMSPPPRSMVMLAAACVARRAAKPGRAPKLDADPEFLLFVIELHPRNLPWSANAEELFVVRVA